MLDNIETWSSTPGFGLVLDAALTAVPTAVTSLPVIEGLALSLLPYREFVFLPVTETLIQILQIVIS